MLLGRRRRRRAETWRKGGQGRRGKRKGGKVFRAGKLGKGEVGEGGWMNPPVDPPSPSPGQRRPRFLREEQEAIEPLLLLPRVHSASWAFIGQ